MVITLEAPHNAMHLQKIGNLFMENSVIAVSEKHQVVANYFEPDEASFLFNRADYFRLHASNDGDVYFQLVNKKNMHVDAALCFFQCGDGEYMSPARGTFGGLSANGGLDIQSCDFFYASVLAYLRDHGARKIEIKCQPCGHDPAKFSIEANILLRNHFIIESQDLNYDMEINDAPFMERVAYNNVKRIRKCERSGMIAESLELSNYQSVYDVIKKNRARRGFSISMSSEQIRDMIDKFPHHMHLFVVYSSEEKASINAAAICISLSNDILYVFYWGDAADMEKYSPIALLAKKIYEFSQHHGYRILDAGTSTVEGEPNYGLVAFKRGLGFNESLKLTFLWRVNSIGACSTQA